MSKTNASRACRGIVLPYIAGGPFMSTARLTTGFHRLFEHSVLKTDVARALRSSVAFVGAWMVCLVTGHASVAPFMATAAQNIALADVRGDYHARFAILLLMTLVMAAYAWTGTLVGANPVSAILMMGAVGLMGGVWRHLSGDYGPSLAIVSALLFLIALSQPGNWQTGAALAGWIALGGAGAIVLQVAAWFFRPQHALRHAVAESWVAASDLITALRTETNEGEQCQASSTSQENALRAALDRTSQVLEAAVGRKPSPFLTHLDSTHHLAARLATRVAAFSTAWEPLRSRPEFAGVGPTIDSVLRALANAARSVALTLITHRAEQFVSLQVRLRRCEHLIRVLDERWSQAPVADSDLTQARQALAQVAEMLPVIRQTLAETADHTGPGNSFPLRLPELGGFSMRALGSWLNRAPQLDPALVRYAARMSVVTMLAVAIYEWTRVPHGYWIAFTALVVLQPDYGSTRQKAAQRIVGTIAGSLLGSALLWVKLPLGVMLAFAGLMAFCFGYFLRRRYGLAVFFVTLMLVLITEAVVPVRLDFTASRLLSNVAGGGMALLAALFFWPRWERAQFPPIMAGAVRANHAYLAALGRRLQSGEPFTGDAVHKKRQAERANSLAAASLQRLLGEPAARRENVDCAAALAAYNQRITRALTVLALQLNQRQRLAGPELPAVVQIISEALERLARLIETGSPADANEARAGTVKAVDACWPNAPGPGPAPSAGLAFNQLVKVATEIDAMSLALKTNPVTAAA